MPSFVSILEVLLYLPQCYFWNIWKRDKKLVFYYTGINTGAHDNSD